MTPEKKMPDNPVKVLFLMDGLTSGGKERRIVELIKGLKSISFIRCELVLMNSEVHYREILDLGIAIHFVIRKTKKDIRPFHEIFELCKKFKPDYLHCWDSMTAVFSVPSCALLGIKLINGMITDSPANKTIFYKPLLRALFTFPFSDVIIGNSKAGLKAYRAPVRKSKVIYNGFDFSRIITLTSRDTLRKQLGITTPYIVGMVAAFGNFKDYRTYFAASQSLLEKRDDVTFLALGHNTDSEESKSLIKACCQGNFRLLGAVSGVESYVNLMDVCVLATYSEGLSNSVMEYMALMKPVVVTMGGGSNEIVEDEKTGFLVRPSNPGELSKRIEQLLDDENLREKMGQAGREMIARKFSITRMVDEFVDLYSSKLSR